MVRTWREGVEEREQPKKLDNHMNSKDIVVIFFEEEDMSIFSVFFAKTFARGEEFFCRQESVTLFCAKTL